MVPATEGLAGRHVLVVEDDEVVRYLHRAALEDVGCIVKEAADGIEALDALTRDVFDLMITDIRMPRLDGWSLAEEARRQRPRLPILYVSAWFGEERRLVPGSKLLDKPVKRAALVGAAAELIQG